MNPLPPKQQAVLDFIRKELEDQGRAPTVREIARKFGWRSPHCVTCHLAAIEKKGFIRRKPFQARGIRLANPTISAEIMSTGRKRELTSLFQMTSQAEVLR